MYSDIILLQDIFIESGIVASGSCKGVVSGKHYNRLRFQAFLSTLSYTEESEILDLLSTLADYGSSDDFEIYIESPELLDVLRRFVFCFQIFFEIVRK